MLNLLLRFFSDGKGTPSSLRLLLYIITLNYLGVWTYKNIISAEFIQLDMNSVLLLVGSLTTKALQTKFETPVESSTEINQNISDEMKPIETISSDIIKSPTVLTESPTVIETITKLFSK